MSKGLSIKRIETGAEPVTVEELKAHLSIDFNDHDVLLTSLLKSARRTVEKYTAVSLVDSDIKVRWELLSNVEELPYGPVKEVTEDDGFEVVGLLGTFVNVKTSSIDQVTIDYKTGYDEVPEDLKLAIMKLATDNFSQRTGISFNNTNTFTEFPNNWKKAASPYSRKRWLV